MTIDPRTGIDREAINRLNAVSIANAPTKGVYTPVPLPGLQRSIFVQPRVGDASSGGPTGDGGSYVHDWDPVTGVKTTTIKDKTGNVVSRTVGGKAQNISPFVTTGSTIQPNGTRDNSIVASKGKGTQNVPPQGRSDNLPVATVATTRSPVILRAKSKTPAGDIPVDYTDVESMDLIGLRNYQRALEYDQMNGAKLTKEQYLKLQRAMDRANELQSPAQTPNPLEGAVKQQEDAKAQTKSDLETQDKASYEAQQQAEQARVEQEMAYNTQQEEKQKNTLGYILGAQGAGTSSYAADKINEIGQNFARQNNLLRAESFARLQKYKAEQAGATRQELEKYDQNILNLQMKSAEFTVQNATKLDEFNKENAKSTEEKLNNIMKLAQAQMAEGIPLTDAEKATAQQYGKLLIDAKGGINEAMLKLIPPKLMNEALAQGAIARGAIPQEAPQTINSSNGAYYRDASSNSYKLIEGTNTNKPNYEVKDGKVYDMNTGKEVAQNGNVDAQSIAIYAVSNRGRENLQCGELVNDYIQMETGTKGKMGDTYQSKVQAINNIGKSNGPAVGGVFAINIGANGHTGIVTKVNDDGSIEVLEANKSGSKTGSAPAINTYKSTGGMVFSKPIGTKQLTPEKQTAIQDILNAIAELEATPGKSGAVGISLQKALPGFLKPGEGQFIPGTDAANFAAKFNSLRDLLTLPNLDKLKGAMSDKDIAFLKSAATSLSLDMTEEEFNKTLEAVKAKYSSMLGIPTTQQQTTTSEVSPEVEDLVNKYF